MSTKPTASTGNEPARPRFLLALAVLALALAGLFRDSFQPSITLFSNDGPLGALSADNGTLPGMFTGFWADLNWLGGEQPSATPNLTSTLRWVLGNIAYSKFYTPVSLWLMGLAAWFFFRQLGFHGLACTLGALAAALNSNYFSNCCWGLASRGLTGAVVFLALAALTSAARGRTGVCVALAGLAVGMGVMEGYDVGAIFSLYVAAFALFCFWQHSSEAPSGRLLKGGVLVAVVALFAAFIAAQTLSTLIGTQVKGVAGMEQTAEGKRDRWDFATQWSLPKAETLRVIIPGLFGYRMDTPDGGAYWGTAGQHPGWTPERPLGYPRHSGSGEYAGVLVVLIALWGAAQSFRREGGPFTPRERKFIWFWSAAALVSLLLAWGRHAPFYQFIYALPYFSTIRNPMKFMHPFQMTLIIVFAYGAQGLWRSYLSSAATPEGSLIAHVKAWWKKPTGFDKQWAFGSLAALAAGLFGWLMFASSRLQLKTYLERYGFNAQSVPTDPNISDHIVSFALGEIGWFLLFLSLAVGILIVILSGALAGRRARGAGIVLGLLLVTDLSRANSPWIQFYDYKEKFAANAILDILRKDAPGHRVAILPFQLPDPQAGRLLSQLQSFHHMEWLQHQYPYYNIQCLDIAQEPRKPQEKIAYENALRPVPARYWQLTNTRFLVGLAGMEGVMNQQFDPVQRRFRVHTPFTLQQSNANATAQAFVTTNGPFALIEFTGTLPRAALYSQWQVNPDLTNTLQTLASPAFDPARTVLVAEQLPAPDAAATNAAAEVKCAHYSPRYLTFKVKADASSVLLLNDRYDPNWKVLVDGQPQPLLRCNYIMRGVHLTKGEHTVEFRFQPRVTSLYVSLAALVVGLGLGVLLLVSRPAPRASPETEPEMETKPAAPANRSAGGKSRKGK